MGRISASAPHGAGNGVSGPAWPADAVERWPLDRLTAYERNARTHSDEQIGQLVASIREWGWTNPVLVDEAGQIIAGHGRVLAARKLGLADAPVMVARGWSEAQKRAYVIADNKLALNSGWDNDLLRLELADLTSLGFDLSLTGFSDFELTALAAPPNAGLTDPDEVPPEPGVAASVAGDVWLLGRHRLVCGDSTVETDVAKALNGVTPHLMVTDPPYGVEYDASWRDGVDLNLGKRLGQRGSGRAIGKVDNDTRADWREAWALFPGSIVYVWHGGLHSGVVQESLEATGFKVRTQIIWVKQHFVFSRGDYHWQHEPCWYAVRGSGNWAGDRKQTSVWEIKNNNPLGGGGEIKVGHSTQKPVECMRRPMENNSSPGQAVYEPFCGSGTSIIAGEMTGRSIHAIELNAVYVDVAVARWNAFTGESAKLEETGETLAELLARRQPEAKIKVVAAPKPAARKVKRNGRKKATRTNRA